MAAAPTLEGLPVLLLDCQSTGANPQKGRLLEVAWARIDAKTLAAGVRPEVTSLLVALPEGGRLPPRIRALTGIEPSEMRRAVPPAEAWRRLAEAAAESGPAVAHFARFERAFIEALHSEHGTGPFPLEWLCTHEIVCRLLPGLPRRGLRAVAGYFGHVMDARKRAASHVRATAAVWSHLAARLRNDAGVHTVADLRSWLTTVPAERGTGRDFLVCREKRLELPDRPGVYRMRARGGEVLYLGKATSLRRRVNSYFQKRRHGVERTPELLTQVFDVDVTVTPSALEAALREADEIKRRAPPYNLALRPRDPAVWFARADLGGVASAADASHVLGPLPHRECADALAALQALLADARVETAGPCWRRALGLRDGTPLEGECLAEGLHAFARRRGLADGRGLDRARVHGLGARLWREHLARRAERKAARESEPEEGTEERGERDGTVRDPEQVVRRLEGTVLRCAHLLRRARWFLRLGESALRWRSMDGAARLLVFGRARLERAETAERADALPVPPGARRCFAQRRDDFDATSYDRLRVLTTEVRRLVLAERDVALRLAEGAPLAGTALARRLYWL